jgi:hypothetical protein
MAAQTFSKFLNNHNNIAEIARPPHGLPVSRVIYTAGRFLRELQQPDFRFGRKSDEISDTAFLRKQARPIVRRSLYQPPEPLTAFRRAGPLVSYCFCARPHTGRPFGPPVSLRVGKHQLLFAGIHNEDYEELRRLRLAGIARDPVVCAGCLVPTLAGPVDPGLLVVDRADDFT